MKGRLCTRRPVEGANSGVTRLLWLMHSTLFSTADHGAASRDIGDDQEY